MHSLTAWLKTQTQAITHRMVIKNAIEIIIYQAKYNAQQINHKLYAIINSVNMTFTNEEDIPFKF